MEVGPAPYCSTDCLIAGHIRHAIHNAKLKKVIRIVEPTVRSFELCHKIIAPLKCPLINDISLILRIKVLLINWGLFLLNVPTVVLFFSCGKFSV
jgi:hypothetical protein